jgi:hypothetical protein
MPFVKERTIEEKLRQYVEVDGPLPTKCWVWTEGKSNGGYGVLYWDDKCWGAHCASYTYNVGPIPEGKEIAHHCDNPPCINPDHLFPATHAENEADRDRKGRRPIWGKSRFRGVVRNHKKWSAKIRIGLETICLGSFANEADAALAWNAYVAWHNLDRPLNVISPEEWTHD